jgi:hypothetical protein
MSDDHPHRRVGDMLCSEHSGLISQLKELNENLKMLFHPQEGILITMKMQIDRLQNFNKIVSITAFTMLAPVLGMIGVFVWEKIKGH